MVRATVSYSVTITRSLENARWVYANLRRQVWTAGAGTRSRPIATAAFDAEGMSEQDIVSSMLSELLRAYTDTLG